METEATEVALGVGAENAERVEIDPDAYHTREDMARRLSKSKLSDFAYDPEIFFDRHIAGVVPGKQSKAFDFGKRLEKLVFYEESPNAVVIPDGVLQRRRKPNSEEYTYARTGAEWEQWRNAQIAEHGPDVALLRQDEFDKEISPIFMARDRLYQHEAAAKLLWGAGSPHVTYQWDQRVGDELIPSKAQLDLLLDINVIVDLKSAAPYNCRNADAFARHAAEFLYHWQMWMYRHAHMAVTGTDALFTFVVVGSEYPFSVGVYTMEDESPAKRPDQTPQVPRSWKAAASASIWREWAWFVECRRTGVWKPRGWGKSCPVTMPGYSYAAEMAKTTSDVQ